LSAEPTVAVVIGSMASPDALRACLEAIEPQRQGTDVVVVGTTPAPDELRQRHPWARFLERPGALVPELWRDGIDASSGEIVALTISPMVPAPDWIAAIRTEHEQHDVVGGAIDPGTQLRLADWGEYFCRYAREMRPFAAGERADVAGDNAAYKRRHLEAWREEWRDGFWENVFHTRLHREGVALWLTPAVLVRQGRSAGAGAFIRQRVEHGRLYGRQRGRHFGRLRNAAGVALSPIVPFLMTQRVLRQVFARGRFRSRALAALPFIFLFNVVWAGAEASGHLEMLRR
jgi:hypothetical protein